MAVNVGTSVVTRGSGPPVLVNMDKAQRSTVSQTQLLNQPAGSTTTVKMILVQ